MFFPFFSVVLSSLCHTPYPFILETIGNTKTTQKTPKKHKISKKNKNLTFSRIFKIIFNLTKPLNGVVILIIYYGANGLTLT